jgi:hypothetical protein
LFLFCTIEYSLYCIIHISHEVTNVFQYLLKLLIRSEILCEIVHEGSKLIFTSVFFDAVNTFTDISKNPLNPLRYLLLRLSFLLHSFFGLLLILQCYLCKSFHDFRQSTKWILRALMFSFCMFINLTDKHSKSCAKRLKYTLLMLFFLFKLNCFSFASRAFLFILLSMYIIFFIALIAMISPDFI